MDRNGIDTQQVVELGRMLASSPEAGRAALRTQHRWEHGYTVTTYGGELHVGGQAIPRTHTVGSDRPAQLGGGDRGPVPGELLLSALAACIGSQLVEHAAVRGIDLDGARITCEGRLDLRGTIDPATARPGLHAVDVQVDVEAAVDDDVLRELLDVAVRTSPVADSLSRGVPVEPTLRRTGATTPKP